MFWTCPLSRCVLVLVASWTPRSNVSIPVEWKPEFCLYQVIGAMLKWEPLIHFLVYTWMRPAIEEKGQALDLPSSPRAPSCRGRRTPQTIKHVASQGRAARILLDRKGFLFFSSFFFSTSVGCWWSLFRAIICRSEQSIQPRQLQLPLAQASPECLCMRRGAQNGHQQTHQGAHTHTHRYTHIQAHAQYHPLTHVHTLTHRH